MRSFKKSRKLEHVCYDIRGPVMDEAKRLEEAGYDILKLNIGNPAPFGFDAPEVVIRAVRDNLAAAQGYTDSKGILPARLAIQRYCEQKGITGVEPDDIYIGNGVSELIVSSMQGLLDDGDEILIPAPDYPLWTAAVNLAGGTAVHYICDEQANWYPDLADLESKITPRTKGIVVINPNNPTGAVYPRSILERIVELAAAHDLIIFADEIYDRILYDGVEHTALASLSDEVLFITLNGLSKSQRIAGYRVGWMVVSGKKTVAQDYIEGLNMLASMRLCSNAPAQYAIEKALSEHSIQELTNPGGRLYEQMDFAWRRLNEIPGLSCVRPAGAFYLFPKVDAGRFRITDDQQFVKDFLTVEKVLLVQGTGFNWIAPDHFRVVLLPEIATLNSAFDRLEKFLATYEQGDRVKKVG
ncbi:MAG TPA: pyridoxal phosphate-dependent aminotransferase [Firmicutes bacterium]|jgi:alanine-synthesizing transaminase|nr:pyridoxal phosphate-dependent aminotransferase [Bacillota bacterium]